VVIDCYRSRYVALARGARALGREAPGVARRRYTAPRLTRLGLLRRLTRYTF